MAGTENPGVSERERKMKVALYARYSTDNQREASIEDQLRNCQRLVERERFEVVATFKDEAISGAKADRPGYLALLEAAKNRDFDLIVVEEVSRLWRDQEEQWRAVKRLEYWGVHIQGVNDGVNTRSEGYGLLLSIRGAMNEEARREIAKRTHRGLTGQALKGFNAGGRSYGYRHVPIEDPTRRDHLGRPVVLAVKRELDPEQSKWVKQIFEWYADGHSPRWIANELNCLGVPSPGSAWNRKKRECKGWAASAIYGDRKRGFGILLNPLYAGRYIWNRTRRQVDPDTKARKHASRPEQDWVVQDAPELRIVSEELWNRVQGRMNEQGEKSQAIRTALHDMARTGRGPKYLFSGLLKCGVCGGNYIVINERSYGCGTRKDRGEHVCSNNLRVPRQLVEKRLLEGIKRDLFSPERIELFKRATQRLLSERRRAKVDTGAVRERLAKLDEQITRMVQAIKDGAYSGVLKSELDKAEAERDRLTASLNANTKGLDKVAEFLPRAIERYQSYVENLESVTLRDVAKARAQIRTLLGDEIRLVPNGGYLEAEISGDYQGLAKLATGNKCGTGERT